MLAGKSQYNVGAKVRITHVADKEDQELVGLTGELTHPFGAFPASYVGVRLDKTGVVANDICNLTERDKFEVID